jgi:hypothetical protein
VNALTNIRVPKNATNVMTSLETITFSRILLHGLSYLLKKSRDSAVGIETTLRARRGSNPANSKKFLSSPKYPEELSGQPSLLFHGVKRPGHDVDPSPSSSAEVKNEWSHASIPYTPS